ncbi:MAG: hypothetical protein GX335_02610, partial [Firmicutes bacterium]|nr:hypothetical protein [Bacillota bacterium]
ESDEKNFVLNHDLVLNGILRIIRDDPGFYKMKRWQSAVADWLASLNNGQFWDYIWDLEQNGRFMKRLLESELAKIRRNPPHLPLQIWLSAAKQYLDDHDPDGFLRLHSLAQRTSLRNEWAEVVKKDIVRSLEQRLENSSQQISETLKRLTRSDYKLQGTRDHNKLVVDEAAASLVRNVRPDVNRLAALPQASNDLARWSKNLLATCLLDISNAYTWAGEWELSNYLLKESALEVVPGSALELKISRMLKRRNITVKSADPSPGKADKPTLPRKAEAGTVYTVSRGGSGLDGLYKVRVELKVGTGRVERIGLAQRLLAKKSLRAALDYYTKHKDICGSFSLEDHDLLIDVTDIHDVGAPAKLTLVVLIALCSAAQQRAGKNQLVVLGSMSDGGSITKGVELSSALQICSDAAAKSILLPMVSADDIRSVPSKLFSKFEISFYRNPADAIVKFLGIE